MSDITGTVSLPTNEEPASIQPARTLLTVVDTVYHQPAGGSPVTVLGDACRFHRELISDEQVYERRRVIGQEWVQIDCGWVERCGMLVVRNLEGQFSVLPTPEQREAVGRRVLELSFDGNTCHIQVPPQESCRFYPSDARLIYIRCREGSARYTVGLVPE